MPRSRTQTIELVAKIKKVLSEDFDVYTNKDKGFEGLTDSELTIVGKDNMDIYVATISRCGE